MDYRSSHLSRGATYDANLAAEQISAYMTRWETRYLAEIMPKLFAEGAGRYLDFACGTGRITQLVLPYAKECVGVDISESMLEVAREKCPQARFVCIDLTAQPLHLGEFDVATSFRFFGNAQQELRRSALRSINRHLKMGGYLVINSHRNPHSLAALSSKLGGGQHDMDLTYFKLKQLLRECGFAIASRRAIGVWIYRARLQRPSVLEHSATRWLERALRGSAFVPVAPDAIIVARKVGTTG